MKFLVQVTSRKILSQFVVKRSLSKVTTSVTIAFVLGGVITDCTLVQGGTRVYEKYT